MAAKVRKIKFCNVDFLKAISGKYKFIGLEDYWLR